MTGRRSALYAMGYRVFEEPDNTGHILIAKRGVEGTVACGRILRNDRWRCCAEGRQRGEHRIGGIVITADVIREALNDSEGAA